MEAEVETLVNVTHLKKSRVYRANVLRMVQGTLDLAVRRHVIPGHQVVGIDLKTYRPTAEWAAQNAPWVTHFHADPHGKASICKVGRQEQIDLLAEGAEGLRKLAAIGDRMTTRHGGCAGCTLQKTCGTCMPLATLYRQANAPLETYCQHGSSGPIPAKPTEGR